MSAILHCDLCLKEQKEMDDLATASKEYQVGDRIKHFCKACAEKVNDKIKALSEYYGNELAKDVREFLLEFRNKNTDKNAKKPK